ncbi:ABC exporter membrane fusion protein [Chlorogloeopsis sp. ULAP01]|uniref:ABC exporter membrane fusion protein n=1 Tax=Chlorogloeopsis sp. ULAP01 TaxID=3056483 RepID=UPI0025AB338C|nr:ABC exporter membrane fusion protein [Chlorogloeopsis sp. ULAP01]MDM9381581.1 ABC exporter membrane fusion protein [Chlorogloeopsis sp. ULAP01]
MSEQSISKPLTRRLIGLILTAAAITGAIAVYGISQFNLAGKPESATPETLPPVKKVAALGRLEPEGEVIHLSAPLALDGDRVAKILVKQGDNVQAGQVVAILDSQKRLQDAVMQAKEQVKMAQAKLAQVKAGAKTGEIQAQQANISRLQAERQTEIEAQQAAIARLVAEQKTEIQAQQAAIARLAAELQNATMEYQRHEKLYQEGALSASLRDSKRLSLQTAQEQFNEAQANLKRIQSSRQQQLAEARANLRRIQTSRQEELNSAKATLNQIAEVRPVDVQAAQTEVDSATAALQQAQTNLEQAYIRTPIAGQILKVHTRAGEKIADAGIADLGQTQQMAVVAEVYQTDIGKIKLGQQAVINSQAFSGELRGKVSEIGLQVNKQNVFSNQPGENLDRRVVEVRIRLNPEDSKRVSTLTNLQVQTAIEL